jgi:hypothetical protein
MQQVRLSGSNWCIKCRTWPTCWKAYTACTAEWVYAVDYLEIVGIITGQFLVGIEGSASRLSACTLTDRASR